MGDRPAKFQRSVDPRVEIQPPHSTTEWKPALVPEALEREMPMRYACLVYVDGEKLNALTDPERIRFRRVAIDCEEELRRGGHLVAVESLCSTTAATTLRVREGRQITRDGPAAELSEPLDTLFVLEARDLNEAIRLAAKHPAARLGGIEIRPVRPRPYAFEARRGNAAAEAG